MKNQISSKLIKKYLAGNCTEAEKKLVDEWYDQFEEGPDFISQLPVVEQEAIKENLLDKIKHTNRVAKALKAKVIRMSKPRFKLSLAYYASRIAAILLLAYGLAFIAYIYWAPGERARQVIAQMVYHNNSKLIKKVVLPDGSKVWLQGNSRLMIVKDFGQVKRKVVLTGEAFFEVAKDKTRPFEIYSQRITTRVLGTSFNIKAYEKDPTVEVEVVTGKVSVFSPDKLPTTSSVASNSGAYTSVVLMPNQRATFVKQAQSLVKKEIPNQEQRILWAKTSLSFENTSIRQVIKKLNEHFATNIKLADEDINHCSIQGDFTNQNLPEILEVICKSIEAEYRLYKDEIIITGEGCIPNNTLP